MKFSDTVNIYTEKTTTDNMGGRTTEKVLLQTIKCRVVPYRVEPEIYGESKINTNHAKLFSKEVINIGEYDDFYIEFNGQMYVKVQYCDYDKVRYILMEKVK